jgi:class 3 adenylate cyclase/tetratricopeptide (TPR) repeat protein
MTSSPVGASRDVAPYLPDVVRRWSADDPPFRRVEGTLVSADISGFTALSERLAGFGREGAEELTELLNRCFGAMIDIVDDEGGDVLKFGGDALLVLFSGADHPVRAASACVRMRHVIERRWTTPLVRRVELGISQGMHAGTFDLHLVDAGHRELLVVGPGMSATVGCEAAAERGEILVSHDAATLLDESALGATTPLGRVLASAPERRASAGGLRPAEASTDVAAMEPFVPRWLIDQVAAGRVAEHRVVTVGFVFFGGVDDLLTSRGPQAVHDRLQALATVTEQATTRHGVHLLATDVYAGGGKLILAAGAPRSTGQDEDAAVRAAKEVLAADVGLPLRAGLNRGPVFMGDLGSNRRCTFTVMGDAVNLAARLMQRSAAGQLIASSAVLDELPTRFELEPLEPFSVKGKTEPVTAALVGAMVADRTAEGVERTSTLDEIPFVGRVKEQRVLEEQLAAASGGRGRVVVVSGEPGIGKSRLVSEVLRRSPGVRVLRASGGLYSRRTPYFAVSAMLRRLAGIDRDEPPEEAGRQLLAWVRRESPALDRLTPLLAIAFRAEVPMTPEVRRIDPANRADRLRDAVVDLLTAVAPGTLVFVVDDAHRLDDASSEVFATVARRIAHRPWLLLVLRWDAGSAFADTLDDAIEIEVGPLSEEEGLAIAADAVARVARTPDGTVDDELEDLRRRGVTNPLFLLELVRSGIGRGEETPSSIEAVVTARIDTLDPADRLLLREAAVLGSVVDSAVLAAALDDPALDTEVRWEPLAGFLTRDTPDTLHFQHGLYREVAYEGLPFRRRRQIHAGVGLELERRAGSDPIASSELLSLHFHEARDWARSWRYSVAAGERASSKYAHGEAADFYARALTVPRAHRPDSADAAAVAEALADSAELDAQFQRASEALTLARRLTPDPVSDVRLVRKQGVIRERQGKYTQALRWYGRGLSASRRLEGPSGMVAECELSVAYAGVRFRQGRLLDSVKWASRAETLARQLDDPRLLAHSAYLLLNGYGMLRRPEAEQYRTLPLQLFEQLGDLVGQANVLNNLGADAKDQSRWSEALDLYRRSRAAREAAGDVVGAATANLNIGEILSDQGHLDEADELLGEALRSWRRADYQAGIAIATCYLGRLQARRGELDLARELLAEALERFEQLGAAIYVLETRAFQLECEVLAGNGAGAIAAAPPAFDLAASVGDPLLEAMLLRNVGWAHYVVGDLDRAEELATQCLQLAEEFGSQYEVALALVLRGHIRQATGGDRTDDHRRARRLLEQLGVVSLPRLRPT